MPCLPWARVTRKIWDLPRPGGECQCAVAVSSHAMPRVCATLWYGMYGMSCELALPSRATGCTALAAACRAGCAAAAAAALLQAFRLTCLHAYPRWLDHVCYPTCLLMIQIPREPPKLKHLPIPSERMLKPRPSPLTPPLWAPSYPSPETASDTHRRRRRSSSPDTHALPPPPRRQKTH